MKTLIKVSILFLFFFSCCSLSYGYTVDPEFMEDEEIEYDGFSSKSSNKGKNTETQESYEYNIDVKNYVTVSYVNKKTVKEFSN